MVQIGIRDFIRAMNTVVDTVIENEQYFCDLDSVAGDGDFGTSLAKGFSAIRSSWDSLDMGDIGAFTKDCSLILMEKCGGASGPIWGNAFLNAAKYSKGKASLNLKEIDCFFHSMIEGVQKVGKASLGDKTLLDALIPFEESLKSSAESGETIEEAFEKAVIKAEEGAESTKEIVATKGRARYLGDRSLGTYDAGAKAIAVILSSIKRDLFDKP